MSRLKIRQGTQWIDVCDKNIHFRNVETGEWIKFNSGDRVRLPSGNWEQIHCSVPCGGSEMLFPMNQPSTFPVPQRFYFDTGLVQANSIIEVYGATVPVVLFSEIQAEDGSFPRGDSLISSENAIHNPVVIGDIDKYRQQWINATGLTPEQIASPTTITYPDNYAYLSLFKPSPTTRIARLTIHAPLQQTLPLKIKFYCPGVIVDVARLSTSLNLGSNPSTSDNTYLNVIEEDGYVYERRLLPGGRTSNIYPGNKQLVYYNKSKSVNITIEKRIESNNSVVYQQNFSASPNQTVNLGNHTIERGRRLFVNVSI